MDDPSEYRDRWVVDRVLLDQRLKRAVAVAVGVLGPGRIEADRAVALGVGEDIVPGHVHDLGLGVDELADQPRAGDPVGFGVFAGDPLHHRSSFLLARIAFLVESIGQPPANRSIRAAMMKSLRESPPTEWVVSRTTSRPQPTSRSGWWPCASANSAIRVASPKAALNVLKVNSRRISPSAICHSPATCVASEPASSEVSGGVPARISIHRSRASDSVVIGARWGPLTTPRIASSRRHV